MKYATTGHIHFMTEEDIFEDGCQPGTGQDSVDTLSLSADTIPALLDAVAELFCLDRKSAHHMEGEAGRVDFQQTVDCANVAPAKHEIESWERGETRLWMQDASIYVVKVEEVDTVEMLKAGIASA